MQICFPALIDDHYVTFVLNMRDEYKEYLTSLPDYKLKYKNKRYSKFEELGNWLMKEAISFMKILYQVKNLQIPYDYDFFDWEQQNVPVQPDGASCGVFTMKFCAEWESATEEMP